MDNKETAKILINKSVGEIKIKRTNKEPITINIQDFRKKLKKGLLITMAAYITLTYGNNIYAKINQDQIDTSMTEAYSSFNLQDANAPIKHDIYDIGMQIASAVLVEKSTCDIYNEINKLNETDKNYQTYNINEHFLKYLSLACEGLIHQPGYSKHNSFDKEENEGWLLNLYNISQHLMNEKIPGCVPEDLITFLNENELNETKSSFDYLSDEYIQGKEKDNLSSRNMINNIINKGKEYQIKYIKENSEYFNKMRESIFGDNTALIGNSREFIQLYDGKQELNNIQYNNETGNFEIVKEQTEGRKNK